MNDVPDQEKAVELLQQLGLKEYEAKCFVALSRRERGTAKEISETSEVPRTRVYDAIRVLETKGLVETQHTNPQVFRAVSVDEAADTLRAEYENRAESLRKTLQGLEPVDVDGETEVTHEIWALSSGSGIRSRTRRLIDDADEEVVLVIGREDVFTEQLVEHIQAAHDRGVDVIVGTVSETLRDRVRESLPDVRVFVSGLDWMNRPESAANETEISRLLLVDREAILVSSSTEGPGGSRRHEQAVFGRGFDNGFVAIVRRLMATGLLFAEDPGDGES